MGYGLPIVITDAKIAEFKAFTPSQLIEATFTSYKYNLFIYLMFDRDTLVLSSPEKTEQNRLALLRHFLDSTDPDMIAAVIKISTEFCTYTTKHNKISHLPIHVAANNGYTDCVLAFLEKFPELYTIEDELERNVLNHALSQPETLKVLCDDPRFPEIRDRLYGPSSLPQGKLNLLEKACIEYKRVYERSIAILVARGVRIRPEAIDILNKFLNYRKHPSEATKDLLRKAHETAPRTSSDSTDISSGSEASAEHRPLPASAALFSSKALAPTLGPKDSTKEVTATHP